VCRDGCLDFHSLISEYRRATGSRKPHEGIYIMKRIAIAVAVLAAFAGHAQASGIEGSINVGGQLTGYTGAVVGGATSTSTGNVGVSSQVAGNGQSIVSAGSNAGGNASVGGTVGLGGAQVATNTNQWGSSNVTVNTNGNAPSMDGTSIVNGGQAVGSSKNVADGAATFNLGAIGAQAGIGGAAHIGGF
jgi:hypothetical protein